MERHTVEKLLFIYNANSGKFNAFLDSAHKVFSPSTYVCSLCDITFGVFAENRQWKKFRTEANVEMDFLHKDEFFKTYKSKFGYKFTFPIVLAVVEGDFEVLIDWAEMNALEKAEDLINLLKERLK